MPSFFVHDWYFMSHINQKRDMKNGKDILCVSNSDSYYIYKRILPSA